MEDGSVQITGAIEEIWKCEIAIEHSKPWMNPMFETHGVRIDDYVYSAESVGIQVITDSPRTYTIYRKRGYSRINATPRLTEFLMSLNIFFKRL